ncbi:MAG: ABC transporter substrate-binding protein [Burkholderia sp.]|jgi:NitT/TauT family transport system substrate-binding protein|uniref:ABC transporter substrate-binding protein n=2 Tax=Burkholderiaceae TaxID=119060 RepID=UPI001CA3A8D4|nr:MULTISPECIES: ABC transporter substrate-binding protein [Burkholderia]MBY8609727.1 ABC transporter substrate-binding protein [Burkholderia arboris]MCA3782073.1 ABC transporter substrate-binding protein [Burkholderia sp.]MCA3788631.1 ABC transporter substrate-binding protein [Burkholderia sp.]MCA3793256.1 ABC transporter substrate-binding protein [Burkholderia sp.]MCA3803277.1 ABC transporter substrate-binding protein [Burkholderia sp.]
MFERIQALARGAVLAAGLWAAIPAAHAADAVRVNLAWLPQGSTGGILVAQAKGFYQDAGLDVTVQRGYGGQRTVNEVDEGLFEFGYGDPVSVILNRAHGGHTVLVGAINTRWPGAMCYLERPGFKPTSLKDLAGLSLGGGNASAVQNIVPAWLKQNGMAPDAIRLVRLDPAVINTALLQKRIDLSECWEGASLPVQAAFARRAGQKLGKVTYRDLGLDMIGSGIVTTDAYVAQHPDVVKRFVDATYRGYALMHDRPQDAVDAIVSRNPLLDRTILREQIDETNALITDNAAGHRLGWLRPERIDATLGFVSRAFALGAKVKAGSLYTNRFVQ